MPTHRELDKRDRRTSSGPGTTRVYIVEDHTFMRHMLRDALEAMPEYTVCGGAATAEEALEELEAYDGEIDLALIDMSLPGKSGADLIQALDTVRPDLLCLILSGYDEPEFVDKAMAAGSRGYVLKGDPTELQHAMEEVLAGNSYLSEPLRTE